MAGDGHDHFICFRDLLIAILHGKDHSFKIRIEIGKLLRRKTHVGRAGIPARCTDQSGCIQVRLFPGTEREILRRIQRTADIHFIAGHTVFFSVVGHHRSMSRNFDLCCDRADHESAVHDLKAHVSKVRIPVFKIRTAQVHLIDSGIRSADEIVFSPIFCSQIRKV